MCLSSHLIKEGAEPAYPPTARRHSNTIRTQSDDVALGFRTTANSLSDRLSACRASVGLRYQVPGRVANSNEMKRLEEQRKQVVEDNWSLILCIHKLERTEIITKSIRVRRVYKQTAMFHRDFSDPSINPQATDWGPKGHVFSRATLRIFIIFTSAFTSLLLTYLLMFSINSVIFVYVSFLIFNFHLGFLGTPFDLSHAV